MRVFLRGYYRTGALPRVIEESAAGASARIPPNVRRLAPAPPEHRRGAAASGPGPRWELLVSGTVTFPPDPVFDVFLTKTIFAGVNPGRDTAAPGRRSR